MGRGCGLQGAVGNKRPEQQLESISCVEEHRNAEKEPMTQCMGMTRCLGGVLLWRVLNARLRKSHVIGKEHCQLFNNGNDMDEKEKEERGGRIKFSLLCG